MTDRIAEAVVTTTTQPLYDFRVVWTDCHRCGRDALCADCHKNGLAPLCRNCLVDAFEQLSMERARIPALQSNASSSVAATDVETTCAVCNEPYINIGHPIWHGAIMQRVCACVAETNAAPGPINASLSIITMRPPTDEERRAFQLRYAALNVGPMTPK